MSERTPGVALEAAARLDRFLRTSVESPLVRALDSDDPAVTRSAVEEALAAIQDLHFLADRAAGERGLHDLTETVNRAVEAYAKQSDLPIEVETEDDGAQVRVDDEAFAEVLAFVLHNAEQFGSGQPVRVLTEGGQPFATVTVEDRGPGFTAEALSRAYDPFYSTSDRGLGLGLPQARHLIEAMGGAMRIRNGEQGGVVELSLPAG